MKPVKSAQARNPLPLYSLFTANAISLVGNVFTTIAIPWFVLQTTGSATQTGITGFFTILPVVLAGFFGGTLIDRLGYKPTSILSDLASGVTTALVPILYFTVGLEFWQLMVLVFLGALLDAPGSTARSALLPELAEQAGMPIERVTSLTHVIERSARMVGAPLAGFLIGIMGTANVLWLDAASFFISAGIVWLLIPTIKVHSEERSGSGKYFDELKGGVAIHPGRSVNSRHCCDGHAVELPGCDLWGRAAAGLCKRGLWQRLEPGPAHCSERSRGRYRRFDLCRGRSPFAAACHICGSLYAGQFPFLGVCIVSAHPGAGDRDPGQQHWSRAVESRSSAPWNSSESRRTCAAAFSVRSPRGPGSPCRWECCWEVFSPSLSEPMSCSSGWRSFTSSPR